MDLTQGHVLKNLITLSLPIMLSNFMQTFYNLTDAFWLGKLGANARNAVSVAGIAFPWFSFIILWLWLCGGRYFVDLSVQRCWRAE